MTGKITENSTNSDSSKRLEEDEIEIPSNFKLLYRNCTNPERDKSSGVSSDEETTSSSLVPIPDTLKQIRNKSKWTASDARELSEVNPTYAVMSSLEELRKKYTLKNESSVALKMNSANLMLDDILNSANLKETSVDSPQPKFFKKEEFRQKTDTESETSGTEFSVPQNQPCAHMVNHCHSAAVLDFHSPVCPRHCRSVRYLPNSIEKETCNNKKNSEGIQRKRSLIEKLQDLQIKYKMNSMYKTLQRKRNFFTRNKRDISANNYNNQQGIPYTGFQGDVLSENKPLCKCDDKLSINQFPKKMTLDLVESSEINQTETNSCDREGHQCTCKNQRKCNCPELLPKCFCVQHIQVAPDSAKFTSHSIAPSRTNDCSEETDSNPKVPSHNTTESDLLPEKGTKQKPRTGSIPKNIKAGWKHCSKERNIIERTDIYYFDHGNSAYYQTTDNHPMRYTECLVERTDEYATKFWAEFFGSIEIGVAFLISFILQLYRFLFTSVIRSLTVGLLQIFSDYFFKPLLTILFNGIIQPCLILVYNITTSVRDLCLPVSEIFGFFAKEVANILRSCRLVDINRDRQPSCNCGNKV